MLPGNVQKNGIADIYSLQFTGGWVPGYTIFFYFHSFTFHLGDWWDYTYTKKAPLVFSSPCLALGWLNTLALVWHPATVANHYETHNKR